MATTFTMENPLNTIPVAKAATLTKAWQDTTNARIAEHMVLRGFNIPKRDMDQLIAIELLTGHTVSGYRGYLAIDMDPDGAQKYKLLLVAIDEYGNDILYMQHDQDVSLVFDFTSPCPTQCGTGNELNNY